MRCHCADAQADEPATTVIGVLAQLALDPLEDAPNSVRRDFRSDAEDARYRADSARLQIYHHSITGFLRLVLGLSILDSPTNEELVLAVLASEPSTFSSSLGPILDALEQLAQLHDEQRAAQSELLASSAGVIGAGPAADDGTEEDAFESQRTEVDETQRDEGGGGDDEMDGLVVSRAAGEDDDAPRRMREVVQRLRRRIA